MKSILDEIDVLEITEDGMVINNDMSMSLVFQLKGVSIPFLSDDEQYGFYDSLRKLFDSLDESCTLNFLTDHQMVKGDISTWDGQSQLKDEISSTIKREHEKTIKGRRVRVSTTHMVVTVRGKGNSVMKAIDREALRKVSIELTDIVSTIQSTYSDNNIGVDRLDKAHVISFFQSQLNFMESKAEPISPLLDLKEVLSLSTIENSKEYVKVGEHYCVTVAGLKLPQELDVSCYLHNVMTSFDFSFKFRTTISVPDQDKILKSLSTKHDIRSSVLGNLLTKMSEESKRSHELATLEELIGIIGSEDEKLFDVSLCFYVMDTDLTKAKEKARIIQSRLNSKLGIKLLIDNYCHLDHYKSLLPSSSVINGRQLPVLSTQLVFFIPLLELYRGTPHTQMMLQTNENKMIPFSLHDNGLQIPHTLVLGSSGGGKSFFINFLLMLFSIYVKQDSWYISIIDMGGSYERLCKLFGGTYIRIEINSKYAISIFPTKQKVLNEHGAIDNDQLIFLSQIMQTLISDGREFTKNEMGLIQKAIKRMYDNESGHITLKCFETYFSEVGIDDKDKEFVRDSIKNLTIYNDPDQPYYSLLNSERTLDMSNPFLVFDITSLADHPLLSNVYLQIISNHVRLRMFNSQTASKKQLVIRDEVWKLLQDPVQAQFIGEEYRTARKYGTTLISVSQGIDDFLGDHVAPIRANSKITCVTPLSQSDQPHKLTHYNFNDNEISACLALKKSKKKYSQIFFKMGDTDQFICHLEPNEMEKQVCSRDFESAQDYKALSDMNRDTLFEEMKIKCGIS